MEIRALESTDIYSLCGIISKIGVEEIRNVFTKPEVQQMLEADGGSDKLRAQVGAVITFEMVSIILKNLSKAKNEIDAFLADLTGEEKEKVVKLSPAKYAKLVFDVIKSEDFSDFIGVVLDSFK